MSDFDPVADNYSPATTTAHAYRRGLADEYGPRIGTISGRPLEPFAPTTLRRSELRAAVDSWTAALQDHGHTSYYGIAHIQLMRAYWLGRLVAYRRSQS